jgi:hypothetical protein
VVRNTHKGSANLDPDGMTLDLFNRIVADVYGEYAADMRWEYFNEWYNTQNLLEEFEITENLRRV